MQRIHQFRKEFKKLNQSISFSWQLEICEVRIASNARSSPDSILEHQFSGFNSLPVSLFPSIDNIDPSSDTLRPEITEVTKSGEENEIC